MNAIIERNATGNTQAYYTRGLGYGGGIGSIISALSGSNTSYYHYDGIGSVTNLTDSMGKVAQTYTYDSYGDVLSSQGSVDNAYQFSTKEYSPKSGLVYFGARWYDPKIGRFITRDPIPALNLYVYCKNNPLNLIDPFGLDTYYINRELAKGGTESPEPTDRRKSHSFVAITDNGTVTDTFSWGNGGQSQWFHNDPIDMAAAQKAIDSGVGVDWKGGEDLDPFVVIEYEKRKNETDQFVLFFNDCKRKTERLIRDAKKQQKKKAKLK